MSLHSVILLRSVRPPEVTSWRRGGGILYLCLTVHAASRPRLCVSVILGSDRAARLASTSSVSPAPGSSAPAGGSSSIAASGAPCSATPDYHRPRVSRPTGEPPGPAQVWAREHSRDRRSGLPGRPRPPGPVPAGGPPGPACARPTGIFSTHCLPSLNGPTVTAAEPCRPSLCSRCTGAN